MSRTIFIGDLHGCYDEAVALMKKCDVGPSDRVVFLGDYVDRGPDSAECCNLVRRREQVQGSPAGILGNHESRHLEHEAAFARGLNPALPPTHTATRMQLKPEHYDWFKALPLYVRFPEHNVVAIHAGAFPGRIIERQRPQHLLHAQMLRPPSEKTLWPSRVPKDEDGWKFWTHFWKGPEVIVFGHSVLDKPLITEKVVGIDGGAVFGQQLHAYILPDKKIVSVEGTRDYGKGRRGRGTDPIRTFRVHGDVSTYS